jgi:hypothetical protein
MLIRATATVLVWTPAGAEAATPICPNGVTVPANQPCPVPAPPLAAPADGLPVQEKLPEPFDVALMMWASCERPRIQEMARRLGRAGPGGDADLASLGNCEGLYAQLQEAIQALPSDKVRDEREALVRSELKYNQDLFQAVYDQNNYE